jgi:hypothetical protein
MIWLPVTALSCRPPVSVPTTDRRPPGESSDQPGGRRLEAAGPGVAAGQLQCLVRPLARGLRQSTAQRVS